MKIVDVLNLKHVIQNSYTYNEVYNKTHVGLLRLRKLINKYNISVSHFTPGVGKSTRQKKTLILKICPICAKEFNLKYLSTQVTCSCSCANKLFRSGENSANWKPYTEVKRKNEYYRKLCFRVHGKKCFICNKQISIDVHHIDNNCANNDPKNLIPICANHHRYLSMKKYRQQILDQIDIFLSRCV